ncbi:MULTISPECIES: DMT family transporter [Marinovum]|jgi:drug/metabolite transporter (DMT)-like permease|uniref:DMT family transporter n=1 Tax=Marinovum TaxID=367771 RepID=UPI00237C3ABE|nr:MULTISPECIES: DMT family transporter [Marinovum]MDD9740254.1 DMT family transporter [Marinovum sp. SP66]MDD9742399.1 DMT family transporter [Marinovum sp. PR37]
MQVLRAILFMTASMACLALSDLFIKLSAQSLPPGQVMFFLSLGGTLLFMLIAALRGIPLVSPAFWHPTVMSRNLAEVLAALGMVTGIAWTPLPMVAAIMQTTPLLVTLGAALFLGEAVGWRRWAAILAGLVGMLLVIRPGMAGFEPAALLVALGACGLAARDLLTRRVPAAINSLTLSTWGFGATVPAGLVLMLIMGPDWSTGGGGFAYIGVAVVVTTSGYYLVTAAMRLAPAAIVSPFRYSRLVFTMGLGVIVLGDRPDTLTLLGATIILISGLYTFFRERQLARAQVQAPA